MVISLANQRKDGYDSYKTNFFFAFRAPLVHLKALLTVECAGASKGGLLGRGGNTISARVHLCAPSTPLG